MTEIIRRRTFVCIFILASLMAHSQKDSTKTSRKMTPFEVLEMQQKKTEGRKDGKTNFDHWGYSQKTHAVVGYLGSIGQGGFSNGNSTGTWHYDLGALYQGKWVDTKGYKLKAHAWVEHTNLVAGSSPKQFAKDLDMISVPNASDAEGSGFALEYLHVENFFFNGFWDVTIGKLEPTFYISYTPYSAWDKFNLFSKTTSSDPVPDMEGAFGVYTEFNFSDYFSVGGQVLDDNPRNEYFDPGNFFGNTTYNYQAFVRWAIPSKKNLYSYHILNYFTYPQSGDRGPGSGWMYIGNQGVSERLILTLKLSHGTGRVFKYNGAYTAGFIYLDPLGRVGDQTGAAFVVNELAGQYDYGIDTFYNFYIQPWMQAAISVQGYYTKSSNVAVIPGVRVMMTY